MRARGLSLWLVPEGAAAARLTGCIEGLAHARGTPGFAPHVTLLGGVLRPEPDVRRACAALARTLRPLSIRLGPVEARDDYFRRVFVRVAETGPLRRARAAAGRTLGVVDGDFMPHLSLVYGKLAGARMAAALREASAVSGRAFVARRLELWRTVGEVRQWRRAAGWPLRAGVSKRRGARAGIP